jgi:predicted nucleic acid-binding protein
MAACAPWHQQLFEQCSARLHVPDPRPVRDCLIAATELVHSMTVVTRHIVDFEPTGVLLLNPWEANDWLALPRS